MILSIVLHTTLQKLPGGAPKGNLELDMPEGSTLGDILRRLEIPLAPDALILVVNHHIADTTRILSDGDQVDIIPAISGG